MPVSGGASGVGCLESRLPPAVLPRQPKSWLFPSTSGIAGGSSLQNSRPASRPQRDLYAALRPLLAERPRQDRTFLDEIDQLQASLRTVQLDHPEDLNGADDGISWLIPSVAYLLPDLDPFGVEGLSVSTLERALQRSAFALRLVGYPSSSGTFPRPCISSPLASDAAPFQGEDVEGDLLEALLVAEP